MKSGLTLESFSRIQSTVNMQKKNEMNCDACQHYCWYYDWCDKWKCEVDARAVYKCFAERNRKDNDEQRKREQNI